MECEIQLKIEQITPQIRATRHISEKNNSIRNASRSSKKLQKSIVKDHKYIILKTVDTLLF